MVCDQVFDRLLRPARISSELPVERDDISEIIPNLIRFSEANQGPKLVIVKIKHTYRPKNSIQLSFSVDKLKDRILRHPEKLIQIVDHAGHAVDSTTDHDTRSLSQCARR